ncbi:hypothetical protein [Streptomyces rugosispiralis]|uniref:Sigma-70 family RNA polymerase sigma factor n=1 Tax=Streptomyces rugosispiralis TaxID=2967341 RepID=A0ABT1V761_9ACTN|nr:hypothetical protein [Streptomyces rugosispiralis]MCQ8193146.1 hypothetical protein [Streptomyces rugosispiralis]
MMSDAVVTAVQQLQSQALRTSDAYGLERIERALDELIRKPQVDQPTPFLIRSALGHAYETIERRKAIAPHAELPIGGQEPGCIETAYDEIEMCAWVSAEPGLKDTDRTLLTQLVRGRDAVTLAEQEDVPVARMRERISRCRRQARQLWAVVDPAA